MFYYVLICFLEMPLVLKNGFKRRCVSERIRCQHVSMLAAMSCLQVVRSIGNVKASKQAPASLTSGSGEPYKDFEVMADGRQLDITSGGLV